MMYFKLLATSIIVFAWKHENARSDEKAEQGKYKYKITSVDKIVMFQLCRYCHSISYITMF